MDVRLAPEEFVIIAPAANVLPTRPAEAAALLQPPADLPPLPLRVVVL